MASGSGLGSGSRSSSAVNTKTASIDGDYNSAKAHNKTHSNTNLFLGHETSTKTNVPMLKKRAVSPVLARQKTIEYENDNRLPIREHRSQSNKDLKTKDDFLKATMRIFLVVSPPVSKLQVRSRSLNHLDTLEHIKHRQSIAEESILKDSHSEPDCTGKKFESFRKLLTVPKLKNSSCSNSSGSGVAGVSGGCGIGSCAGSGNENHKQLSIIGSTSEVTVSATTATTGCSTGFIGDSSKKFDSNERKNLLSRSQLSSSEYFSVSFDSKNTGTGNSSACGSVGSCGSGSSKYFDYDKEEYLPALKGISLREALTNVCKKRRIAIENCEVFIEANDTPLLLSQDTFWLNGKHLKIKERDKKTSLSRKSSYNQRLLRSPFFSSSTEDSNSVHSLSILQHDSSNNSSFDHPKKHSRQRWSGFFNSNKMDTRMELLIEKLNYYGKHGIPSVYCSDSNNNREVLKHIENEPTVNLNDWKDFTEKQKQRQTALWELITTEIAYINLLKVVIDLFLACLQNLQQHGILLEVDKNKLFSNIVEIFNTNLCFWSTYLYPLMEKMKTEKLPINPIPELYDGFIRISDIFGPYIQYCTEQTECQQYCRECQESNELFTAYLAWCETRKECNRLRLCDILVIPMQRLTKYGLLLKAIHRNTDNESDLPVLNEIIKNVDSFVQSVNLNLKQKQETDRLHVIIARIESYEVLECKDEELEKLIRIHNQLDLTSPMFGCSIEKRRHLLLEGDLKLKDNLSSKLEVHCFLLTDMLLICKSSIKKSAHLVKVIRQPYIIDRLIVTELNRETPSFASVYLNEYNVAIGAFILQNHDAKKLKYWMESIKRAQLLYSQAKHASSRQMSSGMISEEFNELIEYNADYNYDFDSFSNTLVPRSPIVSSSRNSRLSSLTHSHSGSVEITETSSAFNQGFQQNSNQKAISISSDESIQIENNLATSAPTSTKFFILPNNSPTSMSLCSSPAILANQSKPIFYVPEKSSFANNLTVQSAVTAATSGSRGSVATRNLVQSLPNLTLTANQSKLPPPSSLPVAATRQSKFAKNTLLVPSTKIGPLLSPTIRGTSYPPPSPPRICLKRGLAFAQNKNPPLLKTRHVNSFTSSSLSRPTGNSGGISSGPSADEEFSVKQPHEEKTWK